MLLQRFDAIEWLAGLRALPVVEEFGLMKDAPLFDEAQGARRQRALKDLAVINSDGSQAAAVLA